MTPSERRFRSLALATAQIVWTTDPEGLVTEDSPSWRAFTGQTYDEWRGWGWINALHPDDRPRAEAAWRRAVAERGIYETEYRVTTPEGGYRWMAARGAPVLDDAGRLVEWVGTNTDITERRQAAAELKAAEQQRREILESISDAFFAVDRQWRFTYVNSQAERVLNRAPGDLIGQVVWEVYPGLRGSEFEAAYRRTMDERVAQSVAAYYPDHDRWYEINAYPAASGITIYFRDVTERRRSEEALRASEQRLRSAYSLLEGITEGTQDLIAALDLDYTYLALNTAYQNEFHRLFGVEAGIGVNMLEALAHLPEERRKAAELWGRALRGEHVHEIEEFGDPGRDRRIFDLRFYPLRNGAGEIVGAAEICSDVTERVQADVALKEADRRKDEFLATLAHELRNPLAPIRNALELLRLGGGAGVLEECTGILDRQVGQMVRLVDDLLDLSRISRGRIELRQERIELGAILESAIETSRPIIDQARHDLVVDLPDEPIPVEGDFVRLAQVFSNLLTNAAKYTEDEGVIQVVAERQGSDAVVSVRDNGVGIPAEKLPTIFDMFIQIDRSLAKSQGGLGIGLTLVKRLLEMHGGSIEARSDGLGTGCEFVVRLPVVIAAPPRRHGEGKAAPPASDAARQRILVVDDNRDSAVTLAKVLALLGNAVETAHDGVEALAIAERFRPQVVLLDIGMPRLNGYETCRLLRERPWARGTTIVALTGWGQDEDRQRSHDAGFDDHLVKPVDANDLAALLRRRAAASVD